MNRVLIVPGLHNSGPEHWQTQWENRLESSYRIELTDWSTPNLTTWVSAIDKAIDQFAPTHMVAHSFGSLATAVIAAKHCASLRGILLVAPADPDKFNVRKQLPASTLRVRGILVGSLSDPWLCRSGARALAEQWGLEIECAGDAGHINVDSGHGEWPQGWKLLQRLLNTSHANDDATRFQQSRGASSAQARP